MTAIRLAIFATLLAASAPVRGAESADSARGERLFETESCVQCHSIGGKGGKLGPDLGSRIGRGYSPALLASVMWNHAPVMWASMRAKGIAPPDIDEQAAADLFAYFYSVRLFDNPSDAARGKQAFASKQCAECHGITTSKAAGAPPVMKWQALGDPIAFAGAMWNHAAEMRDAFATRRVAWPELTGQNLSDMVVYLRNLPQTRQVPSRFETSSEADGKSLFQSKGCASCHNGNLTLGPRLAGKTLNGMAAAMWNHAPHMAKATIELKPGEMRSILSYLWTQQLFYTNGNAARGEKVFASKGCATCHNDSASSAPNLAKWKDSVSAVSMVSVLWQHGPTMLGQMEAKRITWPRFKGEEMSDLIAYLNAGIGKKLL